MRAFKIAAVTLAAGFLVPLLSGAVWAADDSALATLTVTGEGAISRAPDLAGVGATIVTDDANATHALSENNQRFAALAAKLATLGIAGSDISSTSVQSYFNPRPADSAARASGGPFGFVVTRNVEIKVGALGQTGSIIDAATGAGATQINGVTYGFRDRRAVERTALAAAVADAYAQAQAIAAAAHVQIVRILRIGDGSGPVRGMPIPMAMSMAKAQEAPVPTTVTPGDLEVARSISVTYVIR